MPISDEKKAETRDRLYRDPDFRDEFLTKTRNMYMKALAFDASIEHDINRIELILGSDPGTFKYEDGEEDEMGIFERILDAYDKQLLLEEKESSTIN